MRALLVVSFFAVVGVFAAALPAGATQLGSGSSNFTVNPISLTPPPFSPDQYCGNPKYPQTQNPDLALVGNPDFLNVRWDALDPSGKADPNRQIGVDCWMNCPADPVQILINVSACAGYQTCSFIGPLGDHACSITKPRYNFTSDNSVSCRFYDQVLPALGLVVENRTFKTTDYELYTPPVAVTVGSPSSVPIDVKSFGILDTPYTANITALQSPRLVVVQNGYRDTDNVSCGQVATSYPSITMLSAVNIPFSILAHASVDSSSCSTDLDCSYQNNPPFNAMCVSGKCWKRMDVNINAGLSSLPEYNVYGFAFILAACSALFFFGRRKL